MAKEIWRSIKGYKDVEVSDQGRVRRHWDHKVSYLKPIKAQTKKGTYLKVSLTDEETNIQYQPMIHILVANCFLKRPKNSEKREINHIDGNKHNNNVKNLEWVTRAENVKHSYSI